MTMLPTVHFVGPGNRGDVSAENAAYVVSDGDRFEVRALHAQGGYVLLRRFEVEMFAEDFAREVNGLLASWARLSAEAIS